jgi:hypothetical protein
MQVKIVLSGNNDKRSVEVQLQQELARQQCPRAGSGRRILRKPLPR